MPSEADMAEAVKKDQRMERNYFVIGRSTNKINVKTQQISTELGRLVIKANPVIIRSGISVKDLNAHPIK